MKFLLDTNAVSQPSKPEPDAGFLGWLRLQAPTSLALSVISILEINFGTALLPAGRRKAALDLWIREELPRRFVARILPVSADIAADAGQLIARNKLAGHNIEMADALIASTARVHGLSVVTFNRRHFERLEVPLVRF